MGDDEVWIDCNDDDLWVFDKCILSRKLNYNCGPADMWVPKPDFYIVRPCVNLAGMGREAKIRYLEKKQLICLLVIFGVKYLRVDISV